MKEERQRKKEEGQEGRREPLADRTGMKCEEQRCPAQVGT